MARTVQDVIVRARIPLNDNAGTRYPDGDMQAYVLDALHQARSVRPDLFVTDFTATVPDELQLTDPFPLPDQFFRAVVDFVTGSAEMRDDEFAVDGRAMVLQQALNSKLIKGV
jgi:hypothetical protein